MKRIILPAHIATKINREIDVSFYRGILAALAVVYAADQETLYAEIVASVDKKKLIASASCEDLEWSGLIAYGYACKRKNRNTASIQKE